MADGDRRSAVRQRPQKTKSAWSPIWSPWRRIMAATANARIAAFLRDAGWAVKDKRIERLWKRKGLKVPEKQPIQEAKILISLWRRHYSAVRPHSALEYQPPAPEAAIPAEARPVMH